MHIYFQPPDIVELGIDLKEFYKSVEWDILGVPASRCHTLIITINTITINVNTVFMIINTTDKNSRNVKFYTCCDEPYLDITFNITMRRKTLFYTVRSR